MADVLPVLVVKAHQDLVVEVIGGHRKRGHIGRKLEEVLKTSNVDEAKSAWNRGWELIFVPSGEHKSPLAEGRNIDVVGVDSEPGLLDGLRDAPEGIAGEHGRCALHHHQTLHAQMV